MWWLIFVIGGGIVGLLWALFDNDDFFDMIILTTLGVIVGALVWGIIWFILTFWMWILLIGIAIVALMIFLFIIDALSVSPIKEQPKPETSQNQIHQIQKPSDVKIHSSEDFTLEDVGFGPEIKPKISPKPLATTSSNRIIQHKPKAVSGKKRRIKKTHRSNKEFFKEYHYGCFYCNNIKRFKTEAELANHLENEHNKTLEEMYDVQFRRKERNEKIRELKQKNHEEYLGKLQEIQKLHDINSNVLTYHRKIDDYGKGILPYEVPINAFELAKRKKQEEKKH